MKKSTRLIVAIFLVVILSVTAIGVWAAPARVGTVPVLSENISAGLSEVVNIGTGTVSVQADASSGGSMNIEKITDPSTKIGLPPEGWVFLLDQALKITISNGLMNSVHICVPQAPDMVTKTTVFHYWKTENSTWTPIPTEVTGENPPMICGTGSAEGHYALLGK